MDMRENKTHACEDLDKLYNSGYGLKEDPEQMKVVFKKACAAILDLIKSIKTFKYVKIDLPKFLFQCCWLQDCSG